MDKKPVLIEIMDLCFADSMKWLKQVGQKNDLYKPILLLSRVHIEKADSSSFQESVFSASGANMSKFQTKISHDLYEKRCVLYFNRKVIHQHVYKSQ